MEVGQGPNWGCNAKEKKIVQLMNFEGGKHFPVPSLHVDRIDFCCPSPAQSFLVPSPAGLTTILYWLKTGGRAT
jgi:hypothetical protein